jgi:ferredoxin-NADP reductase
MMKYTFDRSLPIKSDITSFVFTPEQPVNYRAGQYFHYVLPHPEADDRGTERWFTNSAAPSEGHNVISTRVNATPGSSFKRALQALRPGDTIEADGPEGDFVIDDPSRNFIFIAGGIGITPFRSILAEAGKQGLRLKVTLLYANRDLEIPFAGELDQLAVQNPDLKIEYITQPARIDTDLISRHLKATENPLVYISGPKPMVKALAEQVTGLGLAEENIKLDDFPGYEAD